MAAKERHGKIPCVRFAEGVLRGEYRNDDMFLGMMEAMVLAKDEAVQGIGNRNFKYNLLWVKWAHLICAQSPAAYKIL